DMFLASQNILLYIEGMDLKSFCGDYKTIDAVVRNIEILGEAVKNISDEFKNKYPEIEWSSIAKTRDKLTHGYFSVDSVILWRIVSGNIPELFRKLEKIIAKENWKDEISK
ncbi:MAG: DUF86 domain-containing protein, partial [Caldisericaceae bacterium]|nr:DUF86 domain-containing protein [Caldisericaceae bacterium]